MLADPSAATTRRDRAVLAAILTMALALRVMYLVKAWNSPGYAWEAPDGYARKARSLLPVNGGRILQIHVVAGGLAFVELAATPDAGPSGEQEVIHVSVAGR